MISWKMLSSKGANGRRGGQLDILVVKMSALGDVIQAMAILRPLKMGFPDARITWLVEESFAPIVQCNSYVDRIMAWPRGALTEEIFKGRQGKEARRRIREFVQRLREDFYYMAIDLQGLMKSGIWMAVARAKRKVGFSQPKEKLSKLFLKEKLRGIEKDSHAVDRYVKMVELLGCPKCNEVDFGLEKVRSLTPKASNFLQKRGATGKAPFVVISPGARWETKRWENDFFAKLADQIRLEAGFEVVFVGAVGDSPTVRDIREKMRTRALDLTGETDLPLLASIMALAQAVVSTDSGPMHLAAAMGTPVIALFGPTAPWRTGPYGEIHEVVRSGVECSPCFRRVCTSRKCMRTISVGEVMEALERILARVGYNRGKRSLWGTLP